jgi:RNA-directed DNA polymerase
MKRQMEEQSVTVAMPKQAEEADSLRNWAEPSVWTERMLMALEQGVKGDLWFSLIDKVWRKRNLESSFYKVSRNGGSAGVDNVSIKQFDRHLDKELSNLSELLETGQYRPSAVRRVYIPKSNGGQRPLGIPTVRDRTVQGAVRQVIEPIFEKTFSERSYGFRPGRSCKDALREIDRLLKTGHHHIVDVDIKGYFDNIPHKQLMERITSRISDSRILNLIEMFLKQPIRDGQQETASTCGVPQGGTISPLLANIYLNPLDHELERQGYELVRYADDMVILCQTQSQAQEVLNLLKNWMEQAGLQLHPEKTRIVDMRPEDEYFDFLGYRFKRNGRNGKIDRWASPKSVANLRTTLRPYLKRCNGRSLDCTIAVIKPILQGWYEYFKNARHPMFDGIDGWVRMRLRSILRKRAGRRGRGRGADHQRWPNNFFAEHGLFSLATAHNLDRQSAMR